MQILCKSDVWRGVISISPFFIYDVMVRVTWKVKNFLITVP